MIANFLYNNLCVCVCCEQYSNLAKPAGHQIALGVKFRCGPLDKAVRKTGLCLIAQSVWLINYLLMHTNYIRKGIKNIFIN